ncbi:MAG: hypothetical protein JWN37_678 [Candidatus Nomurabacteria bacterium]|nr:hypothetical protein [Candidatus Nomurabacteria bacterium]
MLISMTFHKKAFIFLLSSVLLGQGAFVALAQIADDGTSTTTPIVNPRNWWDRSGSTDQAISSLPQSAESIFPIPVLFGVAVKNISPNFGDPRDGGTRKHQGEDIMATKGTPIVSPTKAVVLKVTNGPNEGLTIYTANPGGETFVYMHLDKYGEGVTEGKTLEKGDLIGYVGNTGNASGGLSHLHFEVHDFTGTAVDPYPRLTSEFSLADKITYLNRILSVASDTNAFSIFLVTNFRSTFTSALSQNILLPSNISVALGNTPVSAMTVTPTIQSSLSAGDLAYGETSSAVVKMQISLISKSHGAARDKLEAAGTTGYFGIITKNALIEYQSLMGINPADGYYGKATRLILESESSPTSNTSLVTQAGSTTPRVKVDIPTTNPATSTSSVSLSKDLSLGLSTDEVMELQKYLNNHGYIIAISGPGSLGKETRYFGPATQKAVIKFQKANNINPAAGYVGAITRGKIALLKQGFAILPIWQYI